MIHLHVPKWMRQFRDMQRAVENLTGPLRAVENLRGSFRAVAGLASPLPKWLAAGNLETLVNQFKPIGALSSTSWLRDMGLCTRDNGDPDCYCEICRPVLGHANSGSLDALEPESEVTTSSNSSSNIVSLRKIVTKTPGGAESDTVPVKLAVSVYKFFAHHRDRVPKPLGDGSFKRGVILDLTRDMIREGAIRTKNGKVPKEDSLCRAVKRAIDDLGKKKTPTSVSRRPVA